MRAAPLPVTLVVEDELDDYFFRPSYTHTNHIETLVLKNIYVENEHGEDCVPDLRSWPEFPEMGLPGLKRIEVIGDELPLEYILSCFSAICNSKLPSISLWMTCCETMDLVKLVGHPIFRSIHTIDIATSEATNYLVRERPNKTFQKLLPRRFLRIMTTCLSSRL
jgi:hypothetical protein